MFRVTLSVADIDEITAALLTVNDEFGVLNEELYDYLESFKKGENDAATP